MSKVIINGQEVAPGKKVKLEKHLKRTEIRELLKQKQEEQRGEKPSNNQG